MSGFSSKKAKILLAMGLLAFVMVAVVGMGNDMRTNKNGDMESCIFLTSKVMLCKMGPLEHINLWQKMFTTLPAELGLTLVLLAMLTVLSFVIGKTVPMLSAIKTFALQKLYLRQHIELPIFNPLRVAFAKGILHPKIYETVVF